MNCDSARQALLTAELDELRGRGPGPLAAHVRACADCRAAGHKILNATYALAAKLDAPQRSPWPAWIALPIAASLAGLFVMQAITSAPAVPRVGSLLDVKRPVVTPVVNAPPNRNVAVIKAADDIIVVWDLGAKGGS
jgi:hypothetical protein